MRVVVCTDDLMWRVAWCCCWLGMGGGRDGFGLRRFCGRIMELVAIMDGLRGVAGVEIGC